MNKLDNNALKLKKYDTDKNNDNGTLPYSLYYNRITQHTFIKQLLIPLFLKIGISGVHFWGLRFQRI